jgi:type III secretion protein L
MAAFVRLTGDAVVAPETRVLKARDYMALAMADEVLKDAHQKAAALAAEAKKQYEAEKARGYAEGQELAKAEFAEQIMDTVAQTVDYFAQVEKQVSGVVMSAVRKILGDMDDEEVVVRAVRKALDVVRDQQEITLRVSPEQVEGIKAKIGDIVRGTDGTGYLNVVADPHFLPGACRLETELGVVDVSLDLQLAALEKALASRLSQGPSA